MLLHFVADDRYGYYFPDESEFDETWQAAQNNPEKEFHIMASLRSVFGWIDVAEDFGDSPDEQIRELVENSSTGSRALVAAGAAVEWDKRDEQGYNSREAYNNGRAAIALLDLEYEYALRQGWHSVAIFCLQAIVEFESQIDSAGRLEVERAVELIDRVTATSDIHLGNLRRLLQLLLDNEFLLSPDSPPEKRTFGLCVQVVNELSDKEQYFQERQVLSHTMELADVLNIPTQDLKERYVETYRLSADLQSERGAGLEANELAEALEDEAVREYLSDDEMRELKQRLRSAIKSASRELKREGAVVDSPRQRYLHQDSVIKFVRQFNQIKYVYNTDAALFWLLTRDELVPAFREGGDTYGLHNALSKTMYSLQGHYIEFDPKEADLPARYSIEARIATSTLIGVLDKLIYEGDLMEVDIYRFINSIPDLDSDNLSYLTRIVTNVFEENHMEAIHIGGTQIEAVLYNLLREKGEDVDALMDEGTGTRTLGSLIPRLKGYVDEDFLEYIRYMYNEPIGQQFGGNIRNRVAHGLLRSGENNRLISFIILSDILRVLARVNRTTHHAKYGIPETLLVPKLGRYIFPVVIRPYSWSRLPEQEKFLRYVNGGRNLQEISEYFQIPHQLALVRVRLSEAEGSVSFDEESTTVERI
ncbi:hypothetical protein ACFQAS_01710 [Halopenitus salinus]|uniref:DUF4209 domain-containing protein n=1 Tax=Halopenitus salinus TaxID=1198295 RepID=A0ABD5V121_9EURY